MGKGASYVSVVVGALVLAAGSVALYLIEPDREWVKLWAPAIGGALIVGALTVFAVNVVIEGAIRRGEARRREPLERAAAVELRAIRERIDEFLGKWQTVIGLLREDLGTVLQREQEGEEAERSSHPETLVSRVSQDTFSFLIEGWDQPNHQRVIEREEWAEATELMQQIKRQSDRIVGWYSDGMEFTTPVALGQVQEYLSAVVECMPRSRRARWFNLDEPREEFLAAYRTLWPGSEAELDQRRRDARGIHLAIYSGLRDGSADLLGEDDGRLYVDPRLVSRYDALNPWGTREDFFLELAMSARAILDLGCGTGRLLKRVANSHRSSRWLYLFQRSLAGVDREFAMLDAAEGGSGDVGWEESLITWKRGDARTVEMDRRFDLILMTGGTFQELMTDDDIRMVLSNVRSHLDPGGRFAFDLRSRADCSDRQTVEKRLLGSDRVEFETSFSLPDEDSPILSRNTLRFVKPERLRALIEGAGLRVDAWQGAWQGVESAQSPPDDVVVATLGGT